MAIPKMENLPLEWVRAFEVAGRLGSFTAAAHETGLTQAAISQRIRNLEDRIGTQLFLRKARGVALSVEGEAWLPYVSSALQAVARSADDLFGKTLRKIVISASGSVTQLWVAPRLTALKHKTRYQISMTTMNIEPDFTKANALIEIRYGTGQWHDRQSARLYPEILAPLAAPCLLQQGVDWQDLPRIAVSGPRPGWQEWAGKSQSNAPPVPKYRFDSFAAAHAAAVAGLGVILGTLPLCAAALHDNSLVRLTKNILPHDASYWMTAKRGKIPHKQWSDLLQCFCQP
ncbi:MAG: LysR family transcriptional regulator [Rhodobacterales bacterium]